MVADCRLSLLFAGSPRTRGAVIPLRAQYKMDSHALLARLITMAVTATAAAIMLICNARCPNGWLGLSGPPQGVQWAAMGGCFDVNPPLPSPKAIRGNSTANVLKITSCETQAS